MIDKNSYLMVLYTDWLEFAALYNDAYCKPNCDEGRISEWFDFYKIIVKGWDAFPRKEEIKCLLREAYKNSEENRRNALSKVQEYMYEVQYADQMEEFIKKSDCLWGLGFGILYHLCFKRIKSLADVEVVLNAWRQIEL